MAFPGLGPVPPANPTFNLNLGYQQRSWKPENIFSTRQSNPGELQDCSVQSQIRSGNDPESLISMALFSSTLYVVFSLSPPDMF